MNGQNQSICGNNADTHSILDRKTYEIHCQSTSSCQKLACQLDTNYKSAFTQQSLNVAHKINDRVEKNHVGISKQDFHLCFTESNKQ